jgi:putative acetyltransferase
MTIRAATPEDATRLDELHASSVRALCSSHYALDIIEGWLLNRTPGGYLEPIRRGAIFVAESNGEIVGLGEAAPGIVVAPYVDRSVTGRGIGRRILQYALALARSVDCGPVFVEATLNASAFYRQNGFREVKRATVKRNHVDVPVVVMRHDAAA